MVYNTLVMLLVLVISAADGNGKEGVAMAVIVVGVANEKDRLPAAISLRHSSAMNRLFRKLYRSLCCMWFMGFFVSNCKK